MLPGAKLLIIEQVITHLRSSGWVTTSAYSAIRSISRVACMPGRSLLGGIA
jgi:hypothetical protein